MLFEVAMLTKAEGKIHILTRWTVITSRIFPIVPKTAMISRMSICTTSAAVHIVPDEAELWLVTPDPSASVEFIT